MGKWYSQSHSITLLIEILRKIPLDDLTSQRYLPDPAARTDYCRMYTPPHSVAAPLKHTNTQIYVQLLLLF